MDRKSLSGQLQTWRSDCVPGHSLLFCFRPKGLVGLKDGSSILVFSAFGDVVVEPRSLEKFPFQNIISYPELLDFLENLLKPM